MKGYLHKKEQGWIVVYDKDDGMDGFLLLHPHNVENYSFGFYNGKEVEFKMSEEYLDGNNIFTYAELIMQETSKPDAEKLAEEVYGKGIVPDYEEGFVDGYNKAKETLYTEEQVREIIKDCFKAAKISADFAIKSLDQLKNKNHE